MKKDGNAFVIPEEQDATAFISLGQEVLQIQRLSRVELASEVVFQTHKGERFYFTLDQIVGFKLGAPEARHKPGGAGFTKL